MAIIDQQYNAQTHIELSGAAIWSITIPLLRNISEQSQPVSLGHVIYVDAHSSSSAPLTSKISTMDQQ